MVESDDLIRNVLTHARIVGSVQEESVWLTINYASNEALRLPQEAISFYAADDGLCHAHQRESASGYSEKTHSENTGGRLDRGRGGPDDFSGCPDGFDRARRQPSNRNFAIGVRDSWRSDPGGAGLRGLRVVRHQPFRSAQRPRRLPDLAVSRAGHFAPVAALRHRCLVNPYSDWAFPVLAAHTGISCRCR